MIEKHSLKKKLVRHIKLLMFIKGKLADCLNPKWEKMCHLVQYMISLKKKKKIRIDITDV